MKVLSLTLCRRALLTLMVVFAALTSSCLPLTSPLDVVCGDGDDCKAKVCQNPTVMNLARDVDELEKHIDKYGSVVPKHADVWGQARLMMYRQEFEREMKKDVCTFPAQATIQASITTSDQAFLGEAFGLQAAVGAAGGKALDVSNYISGPEVISRDKLTTGGTALTYAGGKLAIEPTLLEDQKKRYLDHLHELRRINEGDDNADAPGYSLNLVRIPVSVMTGACTQTGYGAECAVTATPHLSDDLLPHTFRELVINDLTGLLTLPVTRAIEQKNEQELGQALKEFEKASLGAGSGQAFPIPLKGKEMYGFVQDVEAMFPNRSVDPDKVLTALQNADKKYPNPDKSKTVKVSALDVALESRNSLVQEMAKKATPESVSIEPDAKEVEKAKTEVSKDISKDVANEVNQEVIYETLSSIFVSTVPTSPHRVEQSPIPPSQLITTLGAHNLGYLTQEIRRTVKDHLACKEAPYHLDVQASLRNELGAAYDFLASPRGQILWRHCTPCLAEAIRTQDLAAVIQIGKEFFHDDIQESIEKPNDTYFVDKDTRIVRTAASILAWAIVVDSALLNEKFLQDMKTTHDAKGCPCPPDWAPLFLPNPPPETCQLFNDYVRCRWPLYVFAIDPETDDQNVADSFRLRREEQLALSLAFTSGKINASSFTRYMRRVEQDIDTISLNRTMVGFSHGDNTFGWRFYPRVQTPPIEGNLEVSVRELLMGERGPGYNLRRRRLENGIRECVAVVIMPSFIPYVDLDVTGNFFRANDPKCKALDLKDVMRLSRSVKAIQDCGGSVCDNDHYRPGDTSLMLAKLNQLSERLPLQHQLVSVPFENTHGGFEMLSAGVTDLAPELNGWYGAPGIDPNGDTALFLVGDNFSVHETRVIAGGRLLDPNCKTLCSNQSSATSPAATPATTTAAAPAAATTPAASPSAAKTAGCSCAAPSVSGGEVEQAEFRLPNHSDHPAKPVSAVNITNVVPAAAAPVLATPVAAAPAAAGAAGSAAPAASASPAVTATVAPAATPAATVVAATVAATSTSCADSAQIPIYQVELLSRQVMRVVIPKGVFSDAKGFVDIHVATPYGVSSHLAIPLNCCSTTCQPTTPKSGFAWDPLPQELIGYIEYEDKTDAGKVKEFHFEDSAANPKKLTIKDSSDIPDAAKVKEAVLVLRLTGAAPAGQNKPFDSTKQLPVTFSDGHFDLLLSALQGLVGDVLKQNLGQSQGLTEISVNAYILPGDGKYDGATPLSNVLKIKLLPPKAATAPK